MAVIEIGYNARHYVTIDIKDATEEELKILSAAEQNDYVHEAFALLAQMKADGRLSDDAAGWDEYLDRDVDPNIISVEEDQ